MILKIKPRQHMFTFSSVSSLGYSGSEPGSLPSPEMCYNLHVLFTFQMCTLSLASKRVKNGENMSSVHFDFFTANSDMFRNNNAHAPTLRP